MFSVSSSLARLASRRVPLQATKATSFATAPTLHPTLRAELRNHRLKYFVGGSVLATAALQAKYGHTKDFFEYRFITEKNPDDLASFYGGEEFMELFCVMPLVGAIMMRGGVFDDEGTVHTQGLPGTLQVSMVFSDETDEDTEKTMWFNKRERFKDVWRGYKCWDMVTNFGFQTLPDGRVECYHTGEYFHGNIPPISLILRLVFQLHSQYVGWATEHHIKHHAFNDHANEDEEHMEEESRTFFLWHLLKNHINPFGKARYMTPQVATTTSTTTVTRKATEGVDATEVFEDEIDEDEEEEEEENDVKVEDDEELDLQKELSAFKVRNNSIHATVSSPSGGVQHRLSIKRQGTLVKINEDIQMDRAIVRRNSLSDAGSVKGVAAYRRATVAARERLTSRKTLIRQNTKAAASSLAREGTEAAASTASAAASLARQGTEAATTAATEASSLIRQKTDAPPAAAAS
jgi:hypothetical protein